jgi:SAM-dependent methyltransferase
MNSKRRVLKRETRSSSVYAYNSAAWDKEAERKVRWSRPVSPAAIAKARRKGPAIFLTPDTPVPAAWLSKARGGDILCLGGGGGQQAPLLATLGRVISADASQRQLDLDRYVAGRDGLDLTTIRTDMARLSKIRSASIDLIVNPCSSCFVRDMRPVWKECHRVLRPGGEIISGHLNPVYFLAHQGDRRKDLTISRKLPYSDEASLPRRRLQAKVARNEPLEFGHTLEALIGEQLRAGFVLSDFFEDGWKGSSTRLKRYTPLYIVLRAMKR